MKSELNGHCISCILHRLCMAMVWFQAMAWSFLLVGSAGLSVYCWFENPEPWASIGHIWIVAGGSTLAAAASSLLLSALASIARKAAIASGRSAVITR